MKPLPLLMACTAAAAATSLGVSLLVSPLSGGSGAADSDREEWVSPDVWADLAETLERIQREQERISDELTDLQMQSGAASAERVSIADIDAAVARRLGELELAEGADDTVASDGAPQLAVQRTAEQDFADLVSGSWNSQEMQEIWLRAREEGRIDELLELFEERAEDDPTNPEKRLQLGQAYLQKIQDVGQGPLAGVYATQADEAFDAALEIDPEHWGARFNKAVALSFWPPVFGKQAAAIQEFETLISQQGGMTPDPSHAQSHLLLGNLYQQLGDRDKAIAAWRQGSTLFPDFQALRQQLLLAGAD